MKRRESLVVSGGMLTQQVFTFTTNVLIARYLGGDDFGIVTVLKGVYTAFILMLPLGMDIFLLKMGGVLREDRNEFYRLYTKCRLTALTLGGIFILLDVLGLGGGVSEFLLHDRGKAYLVLITIITAISATDIQLLGSVARSENKVIRYSVVWGYFIPFSRFLVTFSCLTIGLGLIWVVCVNAGTMIIGNGVLWRMTERRRLSIYEKARKSWRAVEILRESIWMSVSVLLFGGLRFLDIIAISALSGVVQAGHYGAFSAVAQTIQVYPMAIAQTLGPEIAGAMKRYDFEEVRARLRNYIEVSVVISGFIFGGVAGFGDKLDLIFGEEFLFPRSLTLLLSLGFYIGGVYAPIGYVLSMGGRHRMETWVIAIAMALFLIILIPLTTTFGGEGAALSVLLASLGLNYFRAYLIKKCTKISVTNLKDLIMPSIFFTVASILSIFVDRAGVRTFAMTTVAVIIYSLLSIVIICIQNYWRRSKRNKPSQ